MDTTVIVAIVSGLCVAIPSLVATIISNKNSNSLILYRIQELEHKQDKHNGVIERVCVIERDLKSAFYKIDEIKSEIKEIEHAS